MATNQGKKLRVAVIGTGFIGRVHVRSARMAGAEVLGVADADAAIAKEAASALNTPKSYGSPMDAIQDPEVDVIHVCTPNAFHRQYSEEALKAGKHVVCEKPLATSAADAKVISDLAKQKGLVATVPFVYRFHPMVREARARVMNGEIGAVHLIQGSYLQDWLLRASDTNWRVDSKMGGSSRAFADIGSHWCDLTEFVTGHRYTTLCAQMGTTLKDRVAGQVQAFSDAKVDMSKTAPVTTEDLACVLLKTDQGAYGSVVVSQVSAGRKNRLWFEIDGANESAAFDQEEPETLWLGRREHSIILRRDPSQGSPEAKRFTIFPGGHAQGWGDCFEAFMKDTYATVNGAAKPDGLPTFEDGYRSTKITDAVLKSSAASGWVNIG